MVAMATDAMRGKLKHKANATESSCSYHVFRCFPKGRWPLSQSTPLPILPLTKFDKLATTVQQLAAPTAPSQESADADICSEKLSSQILSKKQRQLGDHEMCAVAMCVIWKHHMHARACVITYVRL